MHQLYYSAFFLDASCFSQSEYSKRTLPTDSMGFGTISNSTQLRCEGTFITGKKPGVQFIVGLWGSTNVIKHFDLNSELTDVTFYEKGKRAAHGKMKDKILSENGLLS